MRKIFTKKLLYSGSKDIFLQSPTPRSKKASFSIIERQDGKSKTIYPPALAGINRDFKTKKLSYEQARQLAEEVRQQLIPKVAILHHSDNQKILKRYWEEEYSDRDIIDRPSSFHRLVRATEAAGSYSIQSASKAQLQEEIDGKFKGNAQRRVVSALNQLLKYLERGFKLRLAREEILAVRSINQKELKSLLTLIEDPNIRLMHEVAFATGLRAGELFGLLPEHVKDKHVLVNSQIDIRRQRRQTKNRKERHAVIIAGFKDSVQKWASLPLEERLKFRLRSLAKITRKASHRALGRSICFHDLRHSYCIYWIDKGASLTLVSRSIGDSIKVTERYYSGFLHSSEAIEALDSLQK